MCVWQPPDFEQHIADASKDDTVLGISVDHKKGCVFYHLKSTKEKPYFKVSSASVVKNGKIDFKTPSKVPRNNYGKEALPDGVIRLEVRRQTVT